MALVSSMPAQQQTGSPLGPALEGIVDNSPLENTNYLTYNQVYAKIGATRILQADPVVLHFGGFELGRVYRQTLRIRNVRSGGTRVHIIPPSTPFFKATCDTKRGLIPAGLDEEVVVEFCPQQYRYYYDCVRVHSEEENLLIPIHAYPVMNETKFPKRLDFGVVAFGDVITKKVKMECKVPVEFEFNIADVSPNAAFTIEPRSGVVPAHGAITISVSFSPLRLATEEAVIEVRVAEFASTPVVCTLTGSALPGVAKERLLGPTVAAAHASPPGASGTNRRNQASEPGGATSATAGQQPPLDVTMEHLDGTQALKAAALGWTVNKGGGTLRGGAGNGDAYTTLLMRERLEEAASRDCRETGPIKSKLPRMPRARPEKPLDGSYYPDSLLLTHSEVAYVLNQSPGKLRTKDVAGAIAQRKAASAARQDALEEVLAQGLQAGLHPLERPDVPADVKAALFALQLSQAEEARKKVSLGSAAAVGDDLLMEEEVGHTQDVRRQQAAAHQRAAELSAKRRTAADVQASGALHLPSSASSASAEGGDASTSGAGAHVPEWRVIEGNDWPKRLLALRRFTSAVNSVLYGNRLKRRLDRINEVLNQLGRDPQRIAEESANPVLLVTESDRPANAPTKHMRPELVRVRPLPLYRDVLFQPREPVPGSHYTDFDELVPFKPRVPLEYKILGYTPEEFPGLSLYVPPLLDQPLLPGAEEELPGHVPSAVVPALGPPATSSAASPGGLGATGTLTGSLGGASAAAAAATAAPAVPGLPEACKAMPFVTLELGNRYSEDKVFALPEPAWGVDPAYAIQPREYPLHASSSHEAPSSNAVRSLLVAGAPLLADGWVGRRDAWQVQLSAAHVPALLSGPEPDVLLEDRHEDADKPSLTIKIPTDAEIAAIAPALPRPANPAAPPPAPGAPEAFTLVRQQRAAELEAAKEAAAGAALERVTQKLAAYNAGLRLPCHYALKL